MDSYLAQNKQGETALICFYDPHLLDWDEKIREACQRHSVDPAKVCVIARPDPNGEPAHRGDAQ
jgi:hypothetical protein